MKTVINLQGVEVLVEDSVTVKTVNGIHYLLTTEEQNEISARESAWQAEAIIRNALVEIQRLEALITPRRQREAILGIDNGWLANQEDLIAAERVKLG